MTLSTKLCCGVVIAAEEEEGEMRVEGKEGANRGCVCGGGGAHGSTNDAVL